MFLSKLVVVGLLFAVSGRLSAHALSPTESELLNIPRGAAEKTYDQDTMRENFSFDFTLDAMFAAFGMRMAIVTKMTEDRVQRRNAAGGHDIYAKTTTVVTMAGFPAGSYKMDELVLDGVAWARLVEGQYDAEVPSGWFQPAEAGLDDLEDEVRAQVRQATGVEVKEALLEENATAVTEVAGSTPDTRCFQVTPTNEFKKTIFGDEASDAPESSIESANIQQTFCVEGGFLVEQKMHIDDEEFTTSDASDAKATGSGTNLFSGFGDPVDIPDPRAY